MTAVLSPLDGEHGRGEGVPFAVQGDPDGDRFLEVPASRAGMVELKRAAEAAGERLFCALQLGGCGQAVTVVAGARRRPHFRHPPNSACQVTIDAIARDIHTHRVIQTELARWLRHLGYGSQVERWVDARSRVDVWCSPKAVIEVQLSPETMVSMEDRTSRYSHGDGSITWLFGTNRHISSRDVILADQGLVQLVRPRPEPEQVPAHLFGLTGAGRRIDIGLTTEAADPGRAATTQWWPLAECTFSPSGGLRVPGYAGAAELIRSQRAERERLTALREQIKIRDAGPRSGHGAPLQRGANLQGCGVGLVTKHEPPRDESLTRPMPPQPMGGRRPTSDPRLDNNWWRTSWIDGHWADSLPIRLVDPAWSALYVTMLMTRGEVADLVGGIPDPDRISIVQHLADYGLIEVDTPITAHSRFRTTNDLRYAGTDHAWHQPPARSARSPEDAPTDDRPAQHGQGEGPLPLSQRAATAGLLPNHRSSDPSESDAEARSGAGS